MSEVSEAEPYKLDTEDAPRSSAFRRRFNILALSGGGYRGLFTAKVLEKIEADGGPIRKRFDFIAGTSIGSILAGALAVGVSAERCAKAIEDHGEEIFPEAGRIRKATRGIKKHALAAAYNTEPLETAIQAILGDHAQTHLSALEQGLIIPCVSHTRAELRVFRSLGIHREVADDVPLLNAMLASAAAPTYFPSQVIGTEHVFDGGVVANAPELVAVTDAIRYQRMDLSSIRVLSIGTGSESGERPPEDAVSGNSLGWVLKRELLKVTMEAQAKLAQTHCQALLGANYLHIDKAPSESQAKVIGLDRADHTATRTLTDMADACWSGLADEERTRIRDFAEIAGV